MLEATYRNVFHLTCCELVSLETGHGVEPFRGLSPERYGMFLEKECSAVMLRFLKSHETDPDHRAYV